MAHFPHPSLLALLPLLLLPSCGTRTLAKYDGFQTQAYTIRGIRYYPMSVDQALHYREDGVASWYNESKFLGLVRGNTSLGEKVMPWHKIAAHKTLPIPCKVRVTRLDNGKSVVVRVNDRGPFIAGRIIDLSPSAAGDLGMKDEGLTQVRVEVISVGDGSNQRVPPKPRKRFFFF